MARDKKKDDALFNCSQQHEHEYVIGLYSEDEQVYVRAFLKMKCRAGAIPNIKHWQLYMLIEKALGFAAEE